VEHALRSMRRGTNSANDVLMETMLFASGERQIAKARGRWAEERYQQGRSGPLRGKKEEALGASGLEETPPCSIAPSRS